MADRATQIQLENTNGVPIDPATEETLQLLTGFEIPPYDYIALTYKSGAPGDNEIETVTYKDGGAGGTTVATLTLTYKSGAPGDNEILTITKT